MYDRPFIILWIRTASGELIIPPGTRIGLIFDHINVAFRFNLDFPFDSVRKVCSLIEKFEENGRKRSSSKITLFIPQNSSWNINLISQIGPFSNGEKVLVIR